VGIKIFAIFVSSMIALMAIAASLSGVGINRFLNTQKETLNAVNSIGQRTAVIETRQDIIMRKVIDINAEVNK